jgi:DNA-3-methyladenine glycosylase II
MVFIDEVAKACRHLSANDPVLAKVIEAHGTPDLNPHNDHYGELVNSIVAQQLSSRAGNTIWQRVLDLFGGKMPTPAQLIAVDKEKIRACGVSYSKVAYMKDLAQHVIDKRLDLKHVSTMPNDQLIEQLIAIKGIGVWSAHMFMIFGLGRLDILPVGDLGVRKAAMKLYGLRQLPSPERLVKLSKQNSWPPYESIAAWYLWKSLDNAPK